MIIVHHPKSTYSHPAAMTMLQEETVWDNENIPPLRLCTVLITIMRQPQSYAHPLLVLDLLVAAEDLALELIHILVP